MPAPFAYKSLDELQQAICQLGIQDKLPLSADTSVLATPVTLANGITLANRFVVHPMEGFDADVNGTPGDLAFRRYRRYAEGGYAFIWFEATAVLREARSNPCQLWLNDDNWQVFRDIVAQTKAAARAKFGFEPVMVIQLTHSGRYSRPNGYPQPIIAHHSKFLDPIHKLPADYPLVSDDYLDALQDHYTHAAVLAEKAGFDGIDLKGCHRYLMAELHASHTREGKYGGSFENRTRLMRETLAKIKAATHRIFITTRLNATDEMPYPYGFGMAKDGSMTVDLSETLAYIKLLRELGMPLINITIANPYYQPFYGRPFDIPVIGTPPSPENPLVGVARFLGIIAQIQHANPDFPIIASGYTWLRQFIPNAAAASILNGNATLIGLGRSSFAYPDLPNDLFQNGEINPKKCCITCSRCTQIMRDGAHTGCVIRDAAVYLQPYKTSRIYATTREDTTAFMAAPQFQALPAAPCADGFNALDFVAAFAKGALLDAAAMLRSHTDLPQVCATLPAPLNTTAHVLADYLNLCGF